MKKKSLTKGISKGVRCGSIGCSREIPICVWFAMPSLESRGGRDLVSRGMRFRFPTCVGASV